MAKVYGICGDNKCKREINTYMGNVTYTRDSVNTLGVNVTDKLKAGVYLISARIKFTASSALMPLIGLGASSLGNAKILDDGILQYCVDGINKIRYTTVVNFTDDDYLKLCISQLTQTLTNLDVSIDIIRLV